MANVWVISILFKNRPDLEPQLAVGKSMQAAKETVATRFEPGKELVWHDATTGGWSVCEAIPTSYHQYLIHEVELIY